MGIDKDTFPTLLCIVTPWQENGNVLVWLAHCDALGLPIVVDELVRPDRPLDACLLFIDFPTDQMDLVGTGLPPRQWHNPRRSSRGKSLNLYRPIFIVTRCLSRFIGKHPD